MEVLIAKSGGFCQGVKRAVDTAMSVNPKNTFIFGEIIHNPTVVEKIANRGIKTVNDLGEVPSGATLIIRSHGVPKKVYADCEKKGIHVVDCTCVFVRRTQEIVAREYLEGKQIVIVGEPTHPEVVGLNGWCENTARIISDVNDDWSDLYQKNCSVVAQTTFSEEKFKKIFKNLNDKSEKTVAVFETICYTTIRRQNEARALASECEAMLVLGGLNSSNTNKLYDICKECCPNVFRVASVEDVDYQQVKNFKKVGIVTGASTPNEQAQEVLSKMANETEAKAMTMDAVLADIENKTNFKNGDLITATISAASADGIDVLLPLAKKEVKLDKSEVDCVEYNAADYADKVGEEIELMVVATKPALKLSQKEIKRIKEEEAMLAEIKDGKEFSVECTGFNKGGLTANLGSYMVFVPAGQIRSGYVKELEKYVGKKLRLRVIEIKNEKRKEIIASQRVILEEEKAAKEAAKEAKIAEFFASIKEGDVVNGKVERATSFGAFVSVNGFDCLAHISDLSWNGVSAVSDVLEIGKEYDFKVLKVDEE
ncbi:MAG: 4-hydroxy-3-methylbut-2-enyl diphosphate reductase, partial [Clostridia bacterium]|nr:4-hydroxy-3-methylbut-2-enyl diphosphate reductase [Clostridia bacterium]